jgi:ferric enterobactin receptor
LQTIILIGAFLMAGLLSMGQQTGSGKIIGKVSDSISAGAIEYATITLFAKGDKKVLTGTTTDSLGHFELTGINEGNYSIVVEFIGYHPFTINDLEVDKKKNLIDLKNVVLSKNQSTLQNVTIAAPQGLVENKIDKLVFNAEKDLTSQGGVATDVLKKVPQVSVDVNGNVELLGSTSIRFLINGKPSSAFGSNIADVLQSIPASQIKSIEVITNPGAKYDAQGLGGIINIILKQSKVKGINGNVSLTAGTRIENGSLNINARKGNFGLNAFISGNVRLNSTAPFSSNRLSTDTASKTDVSFQQNGGFQFKRHGYQTGINFDWTYKKFNSFSGSFNYNDFGNNGMGIIDQLQLTTQTGTENILSKIATTSYTKNSFSFNNIDASLSYKRTFNKEDQELEVVINTSSGKNHATVDNYQLLLPQDSLFFGSKSDNPGKEAESEIKLDYTQPIKKDVILGVGGKINFVNINSTSNIYTYQSASSGFEFDSSLSNYLKYDQKVYALYGELSFPVTHLFDAKIGGRYERTNINSFYSNAQQQVTSPGYNTFVPSIYFSKKLTDDQTLKLSFSKRIERPDYMDLNPFINASDPKNITTGNPYLQPEIGYRFEFSYSRNFEKIGSVMATAFYRINDNDIQPYIVFYPTYTVGDTTYTNVSVSTRQNIGTEINTGLNLFADIQATSKLTLRSNLIFFYRHTINAIEPGNNTNSFNYRLNMNAAYQFSPTLAAEFFGNFNSPRHEAQGTYPSFITYSFAMRKQLWNKKGSLALTATNPFNQYVNQRTTIYGSNFTTNSNRQIPFRSIGINFTWKFGKLEFKKEKEEPNGNLNAPAE